MFWYFNFIQDKFVMFLCWNSILWRMLLICCNFCVIEKKSCHKSLAFWYRVTFYLKLVMVLNILFSLWMWFVLYFYKYNFVRWIDNDNTKAQKFHSTCRFEIRNKELITWSPGVVHIHIGRPVGSRVYNSNHSVFIKILSFVEYFDYFKYIVM